jgi:hypothetical protein
MSFFSFSLKAIIGYKKAELLTNSKAELLELMFMK